jgi:hypothetical protein
VYTSTLLIVERAEGNRIAVRFHFGLKIFGPEGGACGRCSSRVGAVMVFIFFSLSGALGPMVHHPSLTTREGKPGASRLLEADTSRIAEVLDAYPGAVVVIANDWPFYYDLAKLREAGREFERRIVNVVRTVGGSKEDAILDFMACRAEPFIVLASRDFEFTERTASVRVDIDDNNGFDDAARENLLHHLRPLGLHASNPLSEDDALRATVSNRELQRAQKLFHPIRAGNDSAFQGALRLLLAKS